MAGFRVFALRYWKRRVVRGFHRWRQANLPRQAHLPTPAQFMKGRGGMVLGSVQMVYEWTSKGGSAYRAHWSLLRGSEDGLASVEAGHDAVQRSANASWFEWLEGSAPLFWNWPERYQREVRDGQPHFMTGIPGPPILRAQSKHKEPIKHELMRANVVKVRKLDYISSGEVVSGTHFFSVDNGETDIRMVYNGTSCGLNAILYNPKFWSAHRQGDPPCHTAGLSPVQPRRPGPVSEFRPAQAYEGVLRGGCQKGSIGGAGGHGVGTLKARPMGALA